MTRTSWLICVALGAGCSKEPSPPAAKAVSKEPSPPAPKQNGSVTPLALAPEVLPGWTFRSAREGWWSAAGDEQLFVSHIELGNLAVGKSVAERAELLANVYREASRREGGAPIAIAPEGLTAKIGRAIACVTSVSVSSHAHAVSCGIARDSGPLLGIEYTSYRDDALDVFNTRARTLIASVAAVAN